jgi:hypothetical protein
MFYSMSGGLNKSFDTKMFNDKIEVAYEASKNRSRGVAKG